MRSEWGGGPSPPWLVPVVVCLELLKLSLSSPLALGTFLRRIQSMHIDSHTPFLSSVFAMIGPSEAPGTPSCWAMNLKVQWPIQVAVNCLPASAAALCLGDDIARDPRGSVRHGG